MTQKGVSGRKLKTPREPRPELTADDIKENCCYRGKHPGHAGPNKTLNDRWVIHISPMRTRVQYDSSAVHDGQQYPSVTMDEFLKWASHQVF